MRSAPRLLLAALVALGVLVLAPGAAFACSCTARTTAELVRSSESVGVGKVEWFSEGDQSSSFAVRFEKVYKGELAEVEKVRTGMRGNTCGLRLSADDKRYVFFLDGVHRGQIRAGRCSAPQPATPQVLRQVGQVTGAAYAPVTGPTAGQDSADQTATGAQWWWPYAVGGVAVLLVGGAVTLGRRRLRRTPGELDKRTTG